MSQKITSINQGKWYAIPADNASEGRPFATGWAIYDETGGLLIDKADRDFVEHVVELHNASLPQTEPCALIWNTRIREAV